MSSINQKELSKRGTKAIRDLYYKKSIFYIVC